MCFVDDLPKIDELRNSECQTITFINSDVIMNVDEAKRDVN